MTFAPMILVQCSIAVVAFGFMLSINVPLGLRGHGHHAVRRTCRASKMRKSMFPVSWLIQARLADVATIVDENINGVRVVKSFAAEQQQLRSLAKAADKVQWGYVKDADLRARWTPTIQNLPQVGLALVLLFGGYMVIHGHLQLGAILAFNSYLLMMQAPFMMLGMIIMMGQRAAASAERIYEILDEQPTIVDRPGAVDLVDCQGDVRFDSVDFAYGGRGRPARAVRLRPPSAPGGDGGPGGPDRSRASRPWPGCSTRFYDVTGGRRAGRRARRAGPDPGQPARPYRDRARRAVPVLRRRSSDNIAYGRPDGHDRPTSRRRRRAAGADEFIRDCPTATTRWWASGATRSRAVSASASPSPGPCW